ncbi:hypothetical protein Dda3937_04464 [Dickeya dadantii 3937]|uniref:Uncharacterized protein n=1 Tax=Dickeya dadantii (strain 3937) TaxID=198628 RepID=E0SKX7_DICD3|nr:hypothetical protein Dda3937_04464 [Dickeya dadantii 3937]
MRTPDALVSIQTRFIGELYLLMRVVAGKPQELAMPRQAVGINNRYDYVRSSSGNFPDCGDWPGWSYHAAAR